MPRVRDLLQRFRPAGAPGAASRTGVPVDRRADLAAELAPLFAQLASTERLCADIRDRSQHDLADIRARDTERASRILAAASARIEAERAASTVAIQHRAEAESVAELTAAQHAAAELQRRALERMPAYVERVVAAVYELLDPAKRAGERAMQ